MQAPLVIRNPIPGQYTGISCRVDSHIQRMTSSRLQVRYSWCWPISHFLSSFLWWLEPKSMHIEMAHILLLVVGECTSLGGRLWSVVVCCGLLWSVYRLVWLVVAIPPYCVPYASHCPLLPVHSHWIWSYWHSVCPYLAVCSAYTRYRCTSDGTVCMDMASTWAYTNSCTAYTRYTGH